MLAMTLATGCTAEGGPEEEVDTVASAQAVDPVRSGQATAGGKCTATSTIRGTKIYNGTYTTNASGGLDCCSSAGAEQICLNCSASVNTCTSVNRVVGTGSIAAEPTLMAR